MITLFRRIYIWAYRQAVQEKLMDTPFSILFWSFGRFGVEFWYRGDTVIWTWPWARNEKAPYISLGLSGNGDFGDARFWTLKELDQNWKDFEEASLWDVTLSDGLEDLHVVDTTNRATEEFGNALDRMLKMIDSEVGIPKGVLEDKPLTEAERIYLRRQDELDRLNEAFGHIDSRT